MSFTLTQILIFVTIAAVVLTALVFFKKIHKNIFVSFWQNFCGAFFLFSGYVKAIDPLGTAYKMEQYFAEFQATFEPTWFSFIAPLFPWLSSFAIQFSVFMIVLEIVLAIMLLIGARPKFASWLFMIIVLFFTVLTGFTFLTGYVPSGATFFEFGKWGAYMESNMKVTDCGCFGDFIKLIPKTSFFKDIFLMVPALLLVWKNKNMHQWLTISWRSIITLITTGAVLIYCWSNYVWDIPHADFRPFKVGVNIPAQKLAEDTALENVEVTAYLLKNKESGEVKKLAYDDYLKNFAQYKGKWEVLEQIKTEPAIKSTKISEFDVSDLEGQSMTDDILNAKGYSFMLIAYQLKGEGSVMREVMVKDTSYVRDTITIENDSIAVVQRIDKVEEKTVMVEDHLWKADYLKKYIEVMNPVMNKAMAEGYKAYLITSYQGAEILDDFAADAAIKYPIYEADDILLKTIVRSNPGLLLLKDGEVIQKWHVSKMPAADALWSKYLK